MTPSTTTPTKSPKADRRIWGEWVFVLFAALLLYGVTLSPNLSAAHDSITYINTIEVGSQDQGWFHPHHLLYSPVAAAWLGLWRYLGVEGSSVDVVTTLNALFGALSVSIFYLLLRRRLSLSSAAALVGTALMTFSYGVWFYSTTVEVYVIPLFFLLWAFYLLTAGRISGIRAGLVGAISGLAVLFHQVHILFAIVVLAALVLRRKHLSTSLPKALSYCFLSMAAMVLIPYGLVMFGVLGLDSAGAAWQWLTTYARDPQFWNAPGLSSLPKAAVGFGRSLVGAHFIFGISQLQGAAGSAFGANWLADEAFLVRNLTPTVAVALLGLAAVFVLSSLAALVYGLRKRRSLPPDLRILLGLTALWFAVYAAFFLLWEPFNPEFWIPQSVCWWLALLILWSRRLTPVPENSAGSGHGQETDSNKEASGGPSAQNAIPWRRKSWLGLAALALLLLAINFAGSIRWLMDQGNDYYAVKTTVLAANAGPGDLIVIGRGWILKHYLERSSDAQVLVLSDLYRGAPDPKDSSGVCVHLSKKPWMRATRY